MNIQSKDQWVLYRLEKFYGDDEKFNKAKGILTGQSNISLRLLDWLVTNYAKKYNISFMTSDNRHVIVYLAYKNNLDAYSKKMFDPFGRGKHIQFRDIETTVGQLNFFQWVIQDEILDYLEKNFDDVQKDMDDHSTTIRMKDESGRRKRHELSRSATKTVCRHDIAVSVSFQ